MNQEVITTRLARERGYIQLVDSDKPRATVRSSKGPVSWYDWCREEVARLQEAGRDAALVRHRDGTLSVGVDPVVRGEPNQYYRPQGGEPV